MHLLNRLSLPLFVRAHGRKATHKPVHPLIICSPRHGLFGDSGQVDGASGFVFFGLTDVRNALGIQKRSVNNIPKPIDPKMV